MHRIARANCPGKCRPGGAGSGARRRRLPEITCGKIWQAGQEQRCTAAGVARQFFGSGGVFSALPAGFAEQAGHERGQSQRLWAKHGALPHTPHKNKERGRRTYGLFPAAVTGCFTKNTRQGHDFFIGLAWLTQLCRPVLPGNPDKALSFGKFPAAPGDAPLIRKPRRTQNTCRPARDAPPLSARRRAPCLPARCPRARR